MTRRAGDSYWSQAVSTGIQGLLIAWATVEALPSYTTQDDGTVTRVVHGDLV